MPSMSTVMIAGNSINYCNLELLFLKIHEDSIPFQLKMY